MMPSHPLVKRGNLTESLARALEAQSKFLLVVMAVANDCVRFATAGRLYAKGSLGLFAWYGGFSAL